RDSSDGNRHRKIRFSVMVSDTETGAFSGTGFLFSSGAGFSRGAGDGFGFLHRGDPLPLIRCPSTTDGQIGQPIHARPAIFAVAGPAAYDFEKTERLAFADARPDGVAMNAVLDELLIGDRELAVVLAAVLGSISMRARMRWPESDSVRNAGLCSIAIGRPANWPPNRLLRRWR